MRIKSFIQYAVLSIAFCLLLLLAEFGGDHNRHKGSNAQDKLAQSLTMIQDVEGVPTRLTHWTDWLSFVAKANAQGGVAHHPIICDSGSVTLTTEGDEYIIKGDGGTCIYATNECVIDTNFGGRPVSIIFEDCGYCIRAEDSAEVNLVTDGAVDCENASGDGIHAGDNATVVVKVGDWINFSADKASVDARGKSFVVLSLLADEQGDQVGGALASDLADFGAPEVPIWLNGGEVDIRAQGNAMVEVIGECRAEDIIQVGHASVMEECSP